MADTVRIGDRTVPLTNGAKVLFPTKVVDLTSALRRARNRDDTDTMSRADLDKRARRLKIKGRSKMSKAELAEAVEQVS